MMMFTLVALALSGGCQQRQQALPNALLVAMAVLETDSEGEPVPQPAQLGILECTERGWSWRTLHDADSNVFHKAMVYSPGAGEPGVLTLGGTRAILKLWHAGNEPEVLWEKDFGGKFSRMRDGEVADLYGDGTLALAVATHDQGVVAVLRPQQNGSYEIVELDHEPDTFIHEIEIGDLDADGVLDIYPTPSARNVLDGSDQPGFVTRYVPATGGGRTIVADLGNRHAKEILVEDVDGNGRDELYVAVEAMSGGRVEIRRYEAETAPDEGRVIAELNDRMCRFLTAGDIDGDGRKEMVAAAFSSGLWLLRPQKDPMAPWISTLIDRQSAGFEHASVLCDLDEDGIDELYVASDKHKEIRRYVWNGESFDREVIHTHSADLQGFTWNLMPAPIELLP
jgi:hypothetical protein